MSRYLASGLASPTSPKKSHDECRVCSNLSNLSNLPRLLSISDQTRPRANSRAARPKYHVSTNAATRAYTHMHAHAMRYSFGRKVLLRHVELLATDGLHSLHWVMSVVVLLASRTHFHNFTDSAARSPIRSPTRSVTKVHSFTVTHSCSVGQFVSVSCVRCRGCGLRCSLFVVSPCCLPSCVVAVSTAQRSDGLTV